MGHTILAAEWKNKKAGGNTGCLLKLLLRPGMLSLLIFHWSKPVTKPNQMMKQGRTLCLQRGIESHIAIGDAI